MLVSNQIHGGTTTKELAEKFRKLGLLATACLIGFSTSIAWDSDDLTVLSSVKTISFPSGFTILDAPSSSAKVLKTLRGAEDANIAAQLSVGGTTYYMTDWSFDRYQEKGIKPSWIRGVVAAAKAPKVNIPVKSTGISNDLINSGRVKFGNEFYEYRTPEKNSVLISELSRLDNRELIYGDDQWIVVGQFVRTTEGAANHHLSLYFSDTLQLASELTVPNYVLSMDWSAKRGQFLVVTTKGVGNERYVKWPEDVAQAILIVDPAKRKLERQPVWQGENADSTSSSSCRYEWRENTIVGLHFTDGGELGFTGDQLNSIQFKNSEFRDIKVIHRKVEGFTPSLQKTRQQYLANAGLDHAGLTGFAKRYLNFSSELNGAVSSGKNQNDRRLVQAMENGFLLDLNLQTLQAKRFGEFGKNASDLGILDDGTVFHVTGDTLNLTKPDRRIQVNLKNVIPNGDLAQAQIDTDGQSIIYANRTGEDDPKVIFQTIDSNGNQGLRRPASFNMGDSWGFAINGPRKTVSIVTGDFDKGRFWKEYSWETGKLFSPPFEDQTGKGIGAGSRTFGKAPPGWNVTSSCTDAYTGGSEFSIEAHQLDSGRKFLLGAGEDFTNDHPLHLFDVSPDSLRVLCCGLDQIHLLKLNRNTGKTEREYQWDWDQADGRALFDPVLKRVFIPMPSGYETFSIRENNIDKTFDLFFRGQNEYAIVLKNGVYAGSPGCETFLNLLVENEKISAAALAQWRNRPAEVLAALGGDPEQVKILERVTERWLKRLSFGSAEEPPTQELPQISRERRQPLWASNPKVSIPINLSAGASPVKELSIRINGVLIPESVSGDIQVPQGKSAKLSPSLTLSPGQNWIEITAIDQVGHSSEPVRFRMILQDDSAKSVRYVVSLGVSEYAHPDVTDLDLAAKDANDMAAMFQEIGGDENTVRTLLLTDEEVIPSAVEKIRNFLSQATVNDEVVFFAAGHGLLNEDLEYVFGAHGLSLDDPSASGIPLENILDAVRASAARRCLILLDTCQAGFVGEREEQLLTSANAPDLAPQVEVIQRSALPGTTSGLNSAETQRFIEDLFLLPGSLRGVHLIGASSAAGFALEIEGIKNGIFTAAVIEAVKYKKADQNHDEAISVQELERYLSTRVPELTGNEQRPSVVASERNQPFILTGTKKTNSEFEGEQFPKTRLERLSRADLQNLSYPEVRYAINELFARHGASFKNPEVRQQFEKLPWYQPDSGLSFDDIEHGYFSEIEKVNLKALANYRNQIKP